MEARRPQPVVESKPSAATALYSYNFKVVFLGDIAVGKTSIIKRYTQGLFTPEYYPTFESTVHSKTMEVPPFKIEFSIWDTSGGLPDEEKAGTLLGTADAAVLVFEVSRRSSFLNLKNYYELIRRLAPVSYIQVVGNKIDLGFRQVQTAEAEQLARELGVQYIETSAVLGTNIERLFNRNLRECLKKRLESVRREMQRDGIS
jgi:small GTP-binding protein